MKDQPRDVTANETASSPAMVRRVVVASTAGTALEWFDYFAYGTAAALVFNELFFPKLSPMAGTLAAFLAFASGFLMRPLGAVFFGHLGDKRGRKVSLVVTVTVMGLTTGLVGLLPTYASVGVLAPILLTLLRLAQGFSLGGEWGGATAICLEHAPAKYRARYNMFVQLGAPIGTLLSTGIFSLVSTLPGNALITWGWRVPFLASFVLLFVGLYMRLKIEESPIFKQALEDKRLAKLPLAVVLRTSWKQVLAGLFNVQLSSAGFYIVTAFVLTYGTQELGLPKPVILTATLIGAVAQMGMVCLYGILADLYGPARVFVVGAALSIVAAFPIFQLIDTKNPTLAGLGVVLGIAIVASPFGVVGVLLGRLFTDETRYTGLSVTYQIGSITGGFIPSIAIGALVWAGGRSWGVSLLLVLIGLVSLIGCLAGQAIRGRLARDGIHTPARQPIA